MPARADRIASMVTIEWVVLCESIYRDQTDRMSLLGIASHLPVPTLPLLLTEHMIVARLSKHGTPEELDVGFGIVTPGGLWVTALDDDAVSVAVSGEYLIITLRALPLRDPGTHRFEVRLSNGSAGSVDIPVWLCQPQPHDIKPQHVH